jgi:hypothetical protein
MRKLFFFTATILFSIQLSAQNTFKKNTLYGEVGGTGIILSANYERQLGNQPGFGLHIGIGLGDNKPAIPFGAKYLFDFGNHKSFMEAGAGITLAEASLLDDLYSTHSNNNPYKAAFIPSIGYTHHTAYGLMWRINYTPVFSRYRNIPFFAGVSVGWRI